MIQTFGDQLNLHPHVHALVTRGGWTTSGVWVPVPYVDPASAEQLFRHKVIRLLQRAGLLDEDRTEMLLSWKCTGFSVHSSVTVPAGEAKPLEALARYCSRSPVSLERRTTRRTFATRRPSHSMYDEVNSGNSLPAQIDIYVTPGMEYRFLFVAKGGGSANKTHLFQETKALLNPASLETFLVDKMRSLGTSACPPYYIAFVVGGTSAGACLKTVKPASTGYYDSPPTTGDRTGRAFRDPELEKRLLEKAQRLGFGAQFGGKYFAHDVRVIRLPRHGASCPIGIGVSCSADRNVLARIDAGASGWRSWSANPRCSCPRTRRRRGCRGGRAA